ncbi:GNAT family N-acetyltransferase [Lacisediminihabitans profunda]|uniref:GNAT family N-acetyltransferase n=1 Tax=Lacisediminihabitans profunda TaxID=2594790 RepID=A0A5C8ULG2_9MICO|nr:GNAT family N-acetyltransferase [Lacisediminihabitans profunda]
MTVLTPVIQSERLLLDSVLPSDAAAVFEYCQDADLQRFVPVPTPYLLSDADKYVTDYVGAAAESATDILWAIRVDGVFAGVIELRLEPVHSATVGFWLGTPWRGQGIMSEALQTVSEYGFEPDGLGLERLHWESVVDNIGSAIVARRAGFHFEGTMRASLVHRGERLDSWQASLLRGDSRIPEDGWPL